MLSTPFWEFRILLTIDPEARAPTFLLPFGSFPQALQPSPLAQGRLGSFLLPFGSFWPGRLLDSDGFRQGQANFLLPFGSFFRLLNSLSPKFVVRYCLSTPFWEFRPPYSNSVRPAFAILILSTPFWEFQRVYVPKNIADHAIPILSTPFWEFLFILFILGEKF